MTLPGETPAVVAMLRTVVFVNPCSANSATAAARILSAVSGDECGERVDGASDFFERMFNIKRVSITGVKAPRSLHRGSAIQRVQSHSVGVGQFSGPSTIRRAR